MSSEPVHVDLIPHPVVIVHGQEHHATRYEARGDVRMVTVRSLVTGADNRVVYAECRPRVGEELGWSRETSRYWQIPAKQEAFRQEVWARAGQIRTHLSLNCSEGHKTDLRMVIITDADEPQCPDCGVAGWDVVRPEWED